MRLAAYYFKMSVKWCILKVLFTMQSDKGERLVDNTIIIRGNR